ncbi:MAG TPA: hypothetical protein VMR41_06425 [Patescibacteria group bacterium]|nr:hypothetical protein [Patescibacteria group bacterium]
MKVTTKFRKGCKMGKTIVIDENPVSIVGLQLAAYAGVSRSITLSQDPEIFDWIENNRFIHLRRSKRYACGHRAARHYLFRLWGLLYPSNNQWKSNLCPNCRLKELKDAAIRCCVCGLPILPGDTTTLYRLNTVKPKDFPFQIMVNESNEYDKYAVGCLRRPCCPGTYNYAYGTWRGNTDPQQK